MRTILLIVIPIVVLILIAVLIILVKKGKNKNIEKPSENKNPDEVVVKQSEISAITQYIQAQQWQQQEELRLKELKKAEQKAKLENFKLTREHLKNQLKGQIDAKTWQPLQSILDSADKGGVGIYVIYNHTKNKYYVGQAKKLFDRIKKHFSVEQMPIDFLNGDHMYVKFLTANELDADYRLDHVEKTGIEIFESDKTGYNKNAGMM